VFNETPVTFECGQETLVGIVANPETNLARGVMIIVGGPQSRTGSHRQFTLLARHLAANGIASMRFDYRGMGDSSGAQRTFEEVGDDIRAAIDTFMKNVPQLTDVVLWGLCDAASAAMLYAHSDRRVSGLVLANPWVRSEKGFAKTQIRHYYAARLLDAEFWKKAMSGKLNPIKAISELFSTIKQAGSATPKTAETQSLPERMLDGLQRFTGHSLIILSGKDLTAREFEDTVKASAGWQARLSNKNTTQLVLPESDHTFSRWTWSEYVESKTSDWVASW
jgi:exosortase A-associated hydrolase 1